jgi:hypothetical protein
MKKILQLSLALLVTTIGTSCTDEFNEINTNPKVLTVDGLDQSSYGFVVKRALYSGVYFDNSTSFLRGHAAFSDVYSNYQAHTHPDFNSDNFVLNGAWLDAFYGGFYSGVAPQVKYAEDYAVKNGYDIENAMMKVWRVYVYHRITDFWGPIPYSKFGNGEKSVPYDKQEDIYKDFFKTLDEAVTLLKANNGKVSFLGAQDVVYSGNVSKWLKLANTLRLRLALRVKYVDASLAKTNAEKAVADGVIESNADNGSVKSTIAFKNQYITLTAWSDFRMSADMESILKGYADPRASKFFSAAGTPDKTDDPAGFTFDFEGIRNGQTKLAKQSGINAISSNMAPAYLVVGDKGPDWPLLRASEAYFLRAEGALEGWNMGGGTTKSFYESGVNASLTEHGTDGKNLAGETYINSTRVPTGYDAVSAPKSTIPVAFQTSAAKERVLEQIITQKWIALYPDSEEAWAERRRTNYPTVYDRILSENPDIPVTKIPRRVPFVGIEYNNNRTAVTEAVATMLGGPDNGVTKLWWDKKP